MKSLITPMKKLAKLVFVSVFVFTYVFGPIAPLADVGVVNAAEVNSVFSSDEPVLSIVGAIVGAISLPGKVILSVFDGNTSKLANTAAVIGGTGALNINTNNKLQEIDGFGAAGINGMAEILWHFTEPAKTRILDALFSSTTGAGLSIMRNEILADNHDKNDPLWGWANPNNDSIEPSKGVWKWNDETGNDRGQVWMMQEAMKRGVNTFLSVAWSPAPWMKDNNSYIRGHLKYTSRQDYADYLSKYVSEYKTRFGIPITHVAPVHEPNYNANYQSADWTTEEVRDLVKVIGPTFARDGVNAKITIAEVNNWSGTMGHVNATIDDPASNAYLGVVSGHGYEGTPQYDRFTKAFTAGKKVWLTEDGDQLSSPGNMNSGWNARNWVKKIHGYVTNAGVSAWLYWYSIHLSDPSYSLMYNSSSQMASGASDYPAGKGFNYRPRKMLHSITHITRFVRPGFRLLDIPTSPSDNSSVYTMAFINPADGNVVIVALNDSNSSYNLAGTITGSSVTSLKPYVTDTEGLRNVAPQPRISAAGGSFSYTIPPNGVVTLVRDEKQPAPPTNNATVYVSDLDASSSGSGWLGTTPIEINKNIGRDHLVERKDGRESFSNFGGDGETISISNKTYTKGLGVEGSSYISYYLGGRATKFSSIIGFDALSGSTNDSVSFQVWGDGVKLYDSGSFNRTNNAKNGVTTGDINVTGVQELALLTIAGNEKTQLDWANPIVVTGSGQGQNPTVSLSIAPTTPINFGGSATLSWSSTNATTCTATGDWSGGKTASASQSTEAISNITRNMSFGLRCSNALGVTADSATVSVTLAQAPVMTFTSSTDKVQSGGSATLTWTVSGATSCTASATPTDLAWSGSKNPAGSSQSITNITTLKSYGLSCTGTGGTTTAPSIPISINTSQNVPPTVSLTSPFVGTVRTLYEGITLPLVATANDSDGSVTKVEFYNKTYENKLIKLSEDTNGADGWKYDIVNMLGGWYNLTAVATDNFGARATSTIFTASASSYADSNPQIIATTALSGLTAPASVGILLLNQYSRLPIYAPTAVVHKVEIIVDGAVIDTVIPTVTTGLYSKSVPLTTVGVHNIKAKAYFTYGGETFTEESNVVSATISAGSSQPVFYKGINFGPTSSSQDTVVDGNTLVGQGRATGLTLSPNPDSYFSKNPPYTGSTVFPNTDASTANMLNDEVVWYSKPATISQTVDANSTYDVYVWVLENYNQNRVFSISLNGATPISIQNNDLAKDAWRKVNLGRTTVGSTGTITLSLTRTTGDAHIMGMAIYKVPSGTAAAFDALGAWGRGMVIFALVLIVLGGAWILKKKLA